jgi:hypothetical protein
MYKEKLERIGYGRKKQFLPALERLKGVGPKKIHLCEVTVVYTTLSDLTNTDRKWPGGTPG